MLEIKRITIASTALLFRSFLAPQQPMMQADMHITMTVRTYLIKTNL